MKVKIIICRENVILPKYEHIGDAGMDLINAGEDISLGAFERALLPTGIKVAIPEGYELQIRPRSGMALKKGITLLNTPGTIDSSYRGEIGIIVFNSNNKPVTITSGERIAQAVLSKFEIIEWDKVDELDGTTRKDGGFGSTGTH
ncbi:MAG: dUTP diphosphatase [Elusimicrobiota bacterium]|jgi:dUTP pyrophosphatase|nr:dUTP diphosphatase [Elusimicrobiota bacterium]